MDILLLSQKLHSILPQYAKHQLPSAPWSYIKYEYQQCQRIVIFLRIMQYILAHSDFPCSNPYIKKNILASDMYLLSTQPREKAVFFRYGYY